MVMRCGIIAIFLLLPVFLLAQAELIPETDPDRVIQSDFDRLSSLLFSGQVPFTYYGTLSGEELRQTHSISLRKDKLSAVWHLRKDEDGVSSGGSLSLENISPVLPLLTFGNYRIRFGKGLVSGISGTNLSNRISDPGTPYYYQPLGVALNAAIGKYSLTAFLSGQSRGYTPADSLISSLPKTKTPRLDTTREQLGGVSLGYGSKQLELAILTYLQHYDRQFSNSAMDNNLTAVSLCGAFRFKTHSLSGETALINKALTGKLDLTLKFPRLRQVFSLAVIPDHQLPAYADRQAILSTKTSANEYGYRLDLDAWRRIRLRLSSHIYQPHTEFTDIQILRQIFGSVTYHDTLSTATLAATVFDREIVQEVSPGDYLSSTPARVRMETRLNRKVAPNLDLNIFLRYHIEDKQVYQSDSWYWNSRVSLKLKPMTIRAGIRNWQSMNMLLVDPDEPDWPQGTQDIILDAGQDELLFDLYLAYDSPRLRFSGKGSVSLLTGETEFSLSLRVTPFRKR